MDVLLEPLRKGIQIGADIGQRVDNTAIIVAELQLRDYTWADVPGKRYVTHGGEIHYVIRHVSRLPLGTSYPVVVEKLGAIYQVEKSRTKHVEPVMHDRLREYHEQYTPRLSFECLVDATGVGQPVVDMLTQAKMQVTAVYLTGGERETREHGEIRLAKTLMVSRLQVLLQQRRIHLPDTAESKALVDELLNYEIKVTESANLQFGAKTGAHDDLATALGLACWDTPRGTLRIEYHGEGHPLYDFFMGRGFIK